MVASVLAYIFGGTTLTTLITFFVYWRLNKRQKVAETKGVEEDTEAKSIANENSKIDLGDRYLESIVKLEDTFKGNTAAVDRLSDKIDRVLTEQERHNRILSAIKAYLNGDFDKWLKSHGITLDGIMDSDN